MGMIMTREGRGVKAKRMGRLLGVCPGTGLCGLTWAVEGRRCALLW